MSLARGDKIGPRGSLGKPGMGEVNRARAMQFSERFEWETETIGTLSDSKIWNLHDVACCRFLQPERKSQIDVLRRGRSA
jgi:hypothetical protein